MATQIINGKFAEWQDKMLFWLLTATVMGAVSWAAWMTIVLFEVPSTGEVRQMIQTEAPYVGDRKYIQEQLRLAAASEQRLVSVIERNTEAITALRIELVQLQASRE